MKYTWWTRLPVARQMTPGNFPVLSISKYSVLLYSQQTIILVLQQFYLCIKQNIRATHLLVYKYISSFSPSKKYGLSW